MDIHYQQMTPPLGPCELKCLTSLLVPTARWVVFAGIPLWNPVPDRIMHLLSSTQTRLKSIIMSCFLVWFYVQEVLIILAAAIGLALNVTVTEFVDTVCSRHISARENTAYSWNNSPYSTHDECNKWFILYLIYSTMLFLHNNAIAQCQYYNDTYRE